MTHNYFQWNLCLCKVQIDNLLGATLSPLRNLRNSWLPRWLVLTCKSTYQQDFFIFYSEFYRFQVKDGNVRLDELGQYVGSCELGN